MSHRYFVCITGKNAFKFNNRRDASIHMETNPGSEFFGFPSEVLRANFLNNRRRVSNYLGRGRGRGRGRRGRGRTRGRNSTRGSGMVPPPPLKLNTIIPNINSASNVKRQTQQLFKPPIPTPHRVEKKSVRKRKKKSSEKRSKKSVESTVVTLVQDSSATKRKRSVTPSSVQEQLLKNVANLPLSQSCFVTGPAGCGKTQFIFWLRDDLTKKHGPFSVYILGTTGVSSINCDGVTVHSFAGFGIMKDLNIAISIIKKNPRTKARWTSCKAMVIDEVSMMNPKFFVLLERIARSVRENNEVFGGIQIIAFGDFLQLRPVKEYGETKEGDELSFVFQTNVWKRMIGRRCYLLNEIFRQSDERLVRVLHKIRIGANDDEEVKKLVRERTIGVGVPKASVHEDIVSTHLVFTNKEAEDVNEIAIRRLPGDRNSFQAVDYSKFGTNVSFGVSPVNGISSKLGSVIAKTVVHVKLRTQVMSIVNDPDNGIANGTRGVVIGYYHNTQKVRSGAKKLFFKTILNNDNGSNNLMLPVVRFENGKEKNITLHCFEVRKSKQETYVRYQLGIIESYAVTFFKSQGLGLDSVLISSRRALNPGEVYTGTSRVRTIKGLFFDEGFSLNNIYADPLCLQYYTEMGLLREPTVYRSDTENLEPPGKKLKLDSETSKPNASKPNGKKIDIIVIN